MLRVSPLWHRPSPAADRYWAQNTVSKRQTSTSVRDTRQHPSHRRLEADDDGANAPSDICERRALPTSVLGQDFGRRPAVSRRLEKVGESATSLLLHGAYPTLAVSIIASGAA